ncbi:MAG TPA: sigma-70 family RNA polymerase sigma factor [Acidimicrobiales bacterium]|jgi:RNA polymerase sigma factor (sigma-70 family)|nr:sigma-70 family RNA polymerase sigma factor [Acidimicrobiales bacterium]
MSSSVFDELPADGRLRTKAHLEACHATVRAASPRWCAKDADFEGVADEVVVSTVRSFDPKLGDFAPHLFARASNRVARSLSRQMPVFERSRTRESIDGLAPSVLDDVRYAAPGADEELASADEFTVHDFFDGLPKPLEAVARLLYAGSTQAAAAEQLGLSPKAVSRLVARLRPIAASHFGRPDLLAA